MRIKKIVMGYDEREERTPFIECLVCMWSDFFCTCSMHVLKTMVVNQARVVDYFYD